MSPRPEVAFVVQRFGPDVTGGSESLARAVGERLAETHQLVYLMEGEGVIDLDNKGYEVAKGAGIYLGPNETAIISQSGPATLKLLHLVVPKLHP